MSESVRILHPITEAASLLGLGRTKVYELVAAGELESVKVGTRRLVPHQALEAFVDRLRNS